MPSLYQDPKPKPESGAYRKRTDFATLLHVIYKKISVLGATWVNIVCGFADCPGLPPNRRLWTFWPAVGWRADQTGSLSARMTGLGIGDSPNFQYFFLSFCRLNLERNAKYGCKKEYEIWKLFRSASVGLFRSRSLLFSIWIGGGGEFTF